MTLWPGFGCIINGLDATLKPGALSSGFPLTHQMEKSLFTLSRGFMKFPDDGKDYKNKTIARNKQSK